jgi:hypothetical protein
VKRLAAIFLLCAGCPESDPHLKKVDMPEAGPDDAGFVGHPPLPQLVNGMKGPVLTTPKVHYVFFKGYANEPVLQDFAKAVAGSSYWKDTTSEYGVGALVYAGTTDLTDMAPAAIGQADLQTWVGTEIKAGAFGAPDPQAIYTIVYPSTTTITQPNPVSPIFGEVKSCTNFSGYHQNVTVDNIDYAYAVIATCSINIGSVTETLTHEWVEASTDPLVTAGSTFTLTGGPKSAFFGPDQDHIIWSLLSGGEAGDLCNAVGPNVVFTPPDIKQPVQRTWSNLSAMGGHDPCVPSSGEVFFDSAPVLTETVSFDSMITGKVVSKGVTIGRDESKTIEVRLFADGDTGGPWALTADDVLATNYKQYGILPTLAFAWDRDPPTGQDGDVLHLTITVTGPSLVSGAHAFMIGSWLKGKHTYWPGLIVEPTQ